MYRVERKNAGAIDLLIANGARIDIRDAVGETVVAQWKRVLEEAAEYCQAKRIEPDTMMAEAKTRW